jgi:hypothetical protein
MFEKFGVGTPVAAGAYVITCAVAATNPVFTNIFNILVTPTSNITWYVSAHTTTTLTVTVSGAGSFFYRVLGN